VWVTTTHEWSKDVDYAHLDDARRAVGDINTPEIVHMILEILSYADDEAAARGTSGHAVVRVGASEISVTDDGRGTDTRRDRDGSVVRKPVMATKDVRFYGNDAAPLLPDGARRRGMSTVAAVCPELVHENQRVDGAWSQTYEYGVPTKALAEVEGDRKTGTTVRLRGINAQLIERVAARPLRTLTAKFDHLDVSVEFDDGR
jgi:DNA gyrase subunit B